MDSNLELEGERLVKEYFWYLVKQYQFTYNHYGFTSENVHLQMWVGHESIEILISRVGEPEFTSLIFSRILQYFEGAEPGEYIDFTHRSLEQNIIFFADKLQEYIRKIAYEIDDWWLPIQKFQYELMEKIYKEKGELDGFLSSYKRDYDYLKSKGAIE